MTLNPFVLTCLFCGIIYELSVLFNRKPNDLLCLCYTIGGILLLFNEYYYWVGIVILILGIISVEIKNDKYSSLYKIFDAVMCCSLLIYVVVNSFITNFKQI